MLRRILPYGPVWVYILFLSLLTQVGEQLVGELYQSLAYTARVTSVSHTYHSHESTAHHHISAKDLEEQLAKRTQPEIPDEDDVKVPTKRTIYVNSMPSSRPIIASLQTVGFAMNFHCLSQIKIPPSPPPQWL